MDASNNTSDVYMNEDGRDDMVNAHQDTENDINMEKEVNLEENIRKLEAGMTFDTIDELFEYYVNYGNENGFPVKRMSSKKGEYGEVRYVSFACSRSGKTESTSRNAFKLHPITKTGCDAKINANLATDGDDKTRLVMDWIKRLTNELSEGGNSSGNKELTSIPVSKPYTSSNGGINHTGNENGIIRSPLAANRKGRPPETRKQPIDIYNSKKLFTQVPTCGSGSNFLHNTSVFPHIQDFGRSHDPNGGILSHGSTLNPYIGASYPFQVQDFDGRLHDRNGGTFL
ncbi:hypothetical protein FRX31_009184 [Thalictrum thalictroides]|uniref:FAR1 domain-containing protein n=1 Tax=Thalictrum thalictroides TaxID=46969 RepID=A0A7J6WV16_THATH|nr:hypothetical protein FRX31_009184 [Thalictrum thalictroides]